MTRRARIDIGKDNETLGALFLQIEERMYGIQSSEEFALSDRTSPSTWESVCHMGDEVEDPIMDIRSIITGEVLYSMRRVGKCQ